MPTQLEALITKYPDLAPIAGDIQEAHVMLLECFQNGGKVLLCGNGGSAADCEHIVGELMKGYLSPRPLPAAVRAAILAACPDDGDYLAGHLQGALPAVSLVSQVSLTSAIANDVAPDMVFAQQVFGYGRPGDVLLAISTSGNSRNILRAAQVARALGLLTIGCTGATGGALRALCSVVICVPLHPTADVQERHLAIYHALCGMLEAALFDPGF
jgi:D-sedoheptulose 7-phosphate isomerase